MSLHAQLSPEAQARLLRQRRNSTISSIAIAILTVALIALVLGIFLLPSLTQETPTIVTYKATLDEEVQQEEKKTQTKIQRKPTPAASARTKVLVANTVSPTAIQVPDVDVTTPSLDFGDMDLGSNWGGGGGLGGGFVNVPASMKKRCSPEDRLARLNETGGTPECEAAVERGLEYLQKTQNPDGSWEGGNKSAMTGLALLCYLGRCETPLSVKYGDTVLKAITFLVNLGMQNEGRLIQKGGEATNSWCYEHAIATYALGEASTFCKQANIDVPNLFEVTRQAGQFIIDHQNDNGGWAYAYQTKGGHTDLSVVAWQLQALKACDHSGLAFKNMRKAVSRGLEYVEQRQGDSGGFAYTGQANGSGKYFNLTGAGLLCLQIWNESTGSSARKAAKYLRENTKFKYDEASHASDLYCHYYEAQAMMNRGGADWRLYNKNFRDEVLAAQESDGSFKLPGEAKHQTNRVHYRTCLNILMLEVYYRFLPGTGSAG
ncbi:MAG: prenyltransferase/squalene oxidase repeat-containing protein [Luteolibacter sp.]